VIFCLSPENKFKSNQNQPKMLFLPQKITQKKYSFMRHKMIRLTMLAGLIMSFYGTLLSQEKMVISQWLSSPVVDINYPSFYDMENTEGKVFSNKDLLAHSHVDVNGLSPVHGQLFSWDGQAVSNWKTLQADENGYIFFTEKGQTKPSNPQISYAAAYIRSQRWIESQLEIKSPYLFEAWLDGKSIGSKNTMEIEENTMGKFTQTIKLTQGTHLLVVKSLRPPEDGLDWKIMANIEIKEPYHTHDIVYSLLPTNIKNINHILDGVKITGVDPSPDASLYAISYSRSLPPSDQSESWTDIKRFSDNRLVHSFRHARIGRVTWLPESNALSYSTTRDNKTSIHWHHMETGEQKTLIADEEKLTGFNWAPDESFIIYSIREDGAGTDATMRQVLGMNDRQSSWRNRSFLYKLDIASGVKTRLTYGNISTSLQSISPDSRYIVFSQSRPDYLERPYSKQDLFLMDLSSLLVDTLLTGQRWAVQVSFSPDGKKLLATGGPSAFGVTGMNVPEGTIPNNYDSQAYIFDLDSREVDCITRDFNPSVSSAYWHPQSNNIFLLTVDEDYQRIYRYDIQRRVFHRLETGVDYVSAMRFSDKANALTFIGNQTNTHKKAYHYNLRTQRIETLEDTESETFRHVAGNTIRNWSFTTSEGIDIKGRYYLPHDFDPDKKYPVIVYYYGGTTPVGRTFGGRYPFNIWAGNGYVVYVLQPSGATGFGQAFSAAHVNNWGITVADEIIEGTRKFLEAHPFADAGKVGCAGASYGGFMTMLLMTRTDLFAAAISHAGISSISSYWGEGYWGYSYSAEATAESFPWNNQDIYIGQSPLFHADKVKTPLLLLTGDSDTNVPPGESIQMYTALKLLGKPVELVMVKGEDHHIVTYSKRILWHNTIMAWWDKHLKDQPEYWFDQYPKKNY
jgi:dipeptidyl aminopeptidase/acylaminoacyl peptidase